MAETVGSLPLHTAEGNASHACTLAVLVCAKSEWNALLREFPQVSTRQSPFGDWFADETRRDGFQCIYFFTGWGKTSAAAAAQYVIDHWAPSLILNVGTCGGFGRDANVGALVVPERTVIYDIEERMGDPAQAIRDYSTAIDTSWLSCTTLAKDVRPVLVSADRDIAPEMVEFLEAEYGAVAADWESGAIAYVASRNGTRILIIRVISDIVTGNSGEAYGNHSLFEARCETIMRSIIERIPEIVAAFIRANVTARPLVEL